MSRAAQRRRVRIRTARTDLVAACQHPVQAGEMIVSYSRGRWQCLACALAERGVSVGELLADEARR